MFRVSATDIWLREASNSNILSSRERVTLEAIAADGRLAEEKVEQSLYRVIECVL